MKRAIFMTGVISLILITVTKDFAVGQMQNRPLLKGQIEENYRKLKSEKFEERYQAVYFFSELSKEEIPEKVFKSMTDLFKEELDREKKKREFFRRGGIAENLPDDIAYTNSEAYFRYQGYLCELIGKSGDNTLLPLLVQYCLDPKALVNFGDSAVDSVIDALKASDNPDRKVSAIFVLREMLKSKDTGYVASGEIRNKIKKVLIQSTKDSDRYVRSSAVRALGESQDKDVIPILENIAKKDPYSVVEKDPSGKEVKRYPVREDAEKVLQKLKAIESEKK